ncbi:Hsp70 family protein, partial [Nocardia thailandica]|uniref:Hsp70 family protein n=1 Tax=Nocardia thailandica TaxID=257275 RepID=UPI0006948141
MTRGLGFSIGAVNSLSAAVADDPAKPVVRTRRTALTFDEAGRPRIGAINEFASAVTDFADLSADPEPIVINGRFHAPTTLVAAVVTGLLELAEPAEGAVLAYPAVYTAKQVEHLGQALHLAGVGQVLLAPEPVAATEWLEVEKGPLAPGFVLVYDLGATTLDLTVVRVGPDWPHHPMVGTPVRSRDFGGKPLGAMVARYADRAGGRATQTLTSMVNTDALRAEHIRDSFPLIGRCVASAGLRMADISHVLLVGGASRAPEVARTIAELGAPVVTSADPGQVVAAGAACLAARTFAPVREGGGTAPHVAVFSSAAVVSALAMSAMTVFGNPFDPALQPVLDHLPALAAPSDAPLLDMSADAMAAHYETLFREIDPALSGRRIAGAVTNAYQLFVNTPEPARVAAAGGSTLSGGERGAPAAVNRAGNCRTPRNTLTGYADPARFVNPLPFPGTPSDPGPGTGGPIAGPGPSVPGTPSNPGTPTAPGTADPVAGTPTAPGGATTPSTGGVTGTLPGSGDTVTAPGTTPGLPAGGTTTGGTTAPGTGTPGAPAGGGTTAGGGGTAGGGTTAGGGAVAGGTPAAGGADGGAGSGGAVR